MGVTAQLNSKFDSTMQSIAVDKEDDLEYDLHHLCAFDDRPLDVKGNRDEVLMKTGRDNCQLLFNHLFSLPVVVSQHEGVLAQLPKAHIPLPRRLPLPKPKKPTKWEEFARKKGIVNRKKRERLVYDENVDEWRPRHGINRANNLEDDWVIEARGANALGGTDPWEEKERAKQERLGKQKKQERSNIVRSQMMDTLHKVSLSTASMGKFDAREKDEPAPKTVRQRKDEAVNLKQEREASLKVLNRMLAKEEKNLELTKAVNKRVATEQKQEAEKRRNSKKRKK